MWLYNEEPYNYSLDSEYVGFVYCITDKSNGKKYIGKKLFQSKRKLPPLKGKTRRRTTIKESDWRTYYGSSDEVREILDEKGIENFHREILHLCKTKGELSYLELKEQMDREVLLSDDYYNGIIQVKIHKSHVRSLVNDAEGVQGSQ
jgi:hypothetical protein